MPDYISFHFYASATARDDPATYAAFFTQADAFVGEVAQIVAIRDALAPGVKIDIDEMGVILPDDNSDKWTTWSPGFQPIYWNAAAAMWAYLYGRLSALNIDLLGESQLVGYPSMPELGLSPQYPSVALLNWTSGAGTARYWVLKLLLDSAGVGDGVVATGTAPPPASGLQPEPDFCGSVPNLDTLTLACATPGATITAFDFASYGTPSGSACGAYAVNATCHAPNSSAIVSQLCVGSAQCSIPVVTDLFGDPCFGTVKRLVVQARCTADAPGYAGDAPVFAQAFTRAAGAPTGAGARRVLLVNKVNAPQGVMVPGAAGGTVAYVDASTGDGPYATASVDADTWTLAPWAVAVVTLPA